MKVGDIVVLKNDYNYTLPQSQVLTNVQYVGKMNIKIIQTQTYNKLN